MAQGEIFGDNSLENKLNNSTDWTSTGDWDSKPYDIMTVYEHRFHGLIFSHLQEIIRGKKYKLVNSDFSQVFVKHRDCWFSGVQMKL